MSRDVRRSQTSASLPPWAPFALGGALLVGGALFAAIFVWSFCLVNVPREHLLVLTKKTGKPIPNNAEIAPDRTYQGVQPDVIGEGRYYYNPWVWDWEVVPQVQIPEGTMGVRIRLHGDEPPSGHIVAWKETEKGIVPEVLVPGRYSINAKVFDCTKGNGTRVEVRNEYGQGRSRENYIEIIELHRPVTVPGGFVGVVTNLSAPLPADPNTLLTEKDCRGVEKESLGLGTYTLNPYVHKVVLVDCRSQRFNLSTDGDMGFPSKDGFWVTLDGVIEFRVKEEDAPRVFVIYNDVENDTVTARVDEEIIKKIVLPNARSFCRLRGSDHSGRDFISGVTRKKFQEDFQQELVERCSQEGIEIVQALITKIYPPQQIAEPVRMKQIAVEQRQQYSRELLQQESEKKLAMETQLNERKQVLVEAEKQVVKVVTSATQGQEVALIEAQQRLKVAELELQAAEDLAAAIMSRGEAEAKVVEFGNTAEAAGWKKAVEAYGGNGDEYARGVMLSKLAPAFRAMMINTADSPIMDIFRQYDQGAGATQPVSSETPAKTAAAGNK